MVDGFGNTILPGEVLVTIPDPDDVTCECGTEDPVLVDRFTIQVLDGIGGDGQVRVAEPMWLCRTCWDREVAGIDNNHRYGVIPIRLTF